MTKITAKDVLETEAARDPFGPEALPPLEGGGEYVIGLEWPAVDEACEHAIANGLNQGYEIADPGGGSFFFPGKSVDAAIAAAKDWFANYDGDRVFSSEQDLIDRIRQAPVKNTKDLMEPEENDDPSNR